MALRDHILDVLGDTFRFQDYRGGVFEADHPFDTGLRSFPMTLVGQTNGCRFLIETDNGTAVTELGGAFVLPEEQRHRITTTAAGHLVHPWAFLQFRVLGTVDLLSLFRVPRVLSPNSGERIGELCVELHRLRETGPLGIRGKMHQLQLGLSILDQILEHAVEEGDLKRLQDLQRIAPVLEYARESLGQPITRSELARICSLSETRFHTVFSHAMRVAPMAYVQRLRMQKARLLLISTDLPIQEIAQRVGIADPFHFSRTFKKTYRLAPRAYRASENTPDY